MSPLNFFLHHSGSPFVGVGGGGLVDCSGIGWVDEWVSLVFWFGFWLCTFGGGVVLRLD